MWEKLTVEIRTDVIKRGTLPAYLRLNATLAMPAQVRHLGPPLAYFVTEIGPLNRVIQLWAYGDMGEMERGRIALGEDDQWLEYLRTSRSVIIKQQTRAARRVVIAQVENLSSQVRDKPVIDCRTYAIEHTRMKDFLDATETYCMPVQLRHIGPPLAYYVTQVGDLDQVTHLWGYDDLADLERRRAARNRDPDWKKYLQASDGVFVNQETCVLRRLNLGPSASR